MTYQAFEHNKFYRRLSCAIGTCIKHVEQYPLESNYYWYSRGRPQKRDVFQFNTLSKHFTDYRECDINGKELKQKEKEMEKVDKNYIGGEYKIAVVYYGTSGIDFGKSYNFKCDIDIDLTKDDVVVVDDKNGLNICTVISILEDNFENATEVSKARSWVVSKIDMERHAMKKQATERREWLVNKLEERKERVSVNEMYALLAKSDKESAKYLEELNKLGGSTNV